MVCLRITPQQAARTMAELVPSIVGGTRIGLFAKAGITQTQFSVLVATHARSRCTMTQLTNSLLVSMPTMTGIVDRLERAKYVKRCACPTDRRQTYVELTDKGREFMNEVVELIQQRWVGILSEFTPRELKAFHRLMSKVQLVVTPAPEETCRHGA